MSAAAPQGQPPAGVRETSLDDTPALHERIDRVGFALLGGATVMFFLGFVFAYFYLRSLNTNGLWRPAGVEPPTAYGLVIVASLVLSALVFGWGARDAERGGGRWVAASGVALALGLVAVIAQGFEYAHLGFGPESGGYASVFIGWTSLYAVAVLLTMYRLEIALAVGIRNRRKTGSAAAPEGLVAGAAYWGLLAAIGLFAWVILYLVS
ncbi:MAG TPA: cytochrome c oxidase subunit 3 [Solirubrobacterales bacterium]